MRLKTLRGAEDMHSDRGRNGEGRKVTLVPLRQDTGSNLFLHGAVALRMNERKRHDMR